MSESSHNYTEILRNSALIGSFVFLLIGILPFFGNTIGSIFYMESRYSILNIIYFATAIYLFQQTKANEQDLFKASRRLAYFYTTFSVVGMIYGGELFGFIWINFFTSLLHIALTLLFIYVGFILDNREDDEFEE